MTYDPLSQESLLSLINKGTSLIKGVALRLGISLFAIITAIAITDNLPYSIRSLKGYGNFSTFLSIYIGLICLVPRIKKDFPLWSICTLSGVVQSLCLFLLGLPWQLTILWGGLQTWILRMLLSNFSLGWEWSVSLWLFISGIVTISIFNGIFSYTWLLVTIPAVTISGLASFFLYQKLFVAPKHRKEITILLDKFRHYLETGSTPAPLLEPSKKLIQQTLVATTSLSLPNDASFLLHKHLPTIVHDLELINAQNHDEKNSDSYVFYNDILGQKGLSHIMSLSQGIAPYLQKKEMQSELLSSEEQSSENRYLAFQALSRELTKRKGRLPQKLHGHIDALRNSVQLIIELMQENTQDFEQAERFLSRYLPASIKLIDNYLKLSDKQVESKDVEEILNKLEEVLQRLENAFQTEYLSHVENHTIDVKADLATLDTLLRIKGY